MTSPDRYQERLNQLTRNLTDVWDSSVKQGVTDYTELCAALAAAALSHTPPPPAPADHRLPPYSGEFTVCVKCSHGEAITRHLRAGESGTNGPHYWTSPKVERLERQCWRCDYIWDEALAPPTGPAPYDVAAGDLARLLQASHDGWALDLSPECAEHMAGALLTKLSIRYRHDYQPETGHAEESETSHTGPAAAPTLTDPAHEGTDL
ncbi:hypothetical protein [Streptomyces sp. NPDC057250]|uniref:hypothetical protein n=1 Tax=Streptomyces sp. NPDC057250 TaxID=3346068 RepID=UPI00363E504E